MFDRGQLDKWITIVHAVEPREDRDHTKLDDNFEIAAETEEEKRKPRYRESDHVKAYYRTNRY